MCVESLVVMFLLVAHFCMLLMYDLWVGSCCVDVGVYIVTVFLLCCLCVVKLMLL